MQAPQGDALSRVTGLGVEWRGAGWSISILGAYIHVYLPSTHSLLVF